MTGRRSSTKPLPAHGLAITAATATIKTGGEACLPPSMKVVSVNFTVL